ncbi:MAG: damage-inducible protein DinB [Altibacter sp.]|uniref:DinB family protein n=1 Tax=Altibacter sp. TaxID=2024823 RepID=UPI001DFD3B60|nr:DinB family protein [Altibacter sp.]MBZ0326844.1 damage-inducible protein DinB [Altibacter sp.]
MKDFFIEKFQYNFDSNQRMINCMEANSKAYTQRAQDLIGHTFNAHHIWNCRILGQTPKQTVWEVFQLKDLHQMNTATNNQSMDILSSFELTKITEYTNTRGQSYSNRVDDILYHIINHSTYHRGQLMTELKQHGVIPISTDYIFFKR